jgi:hypothetical protein
VTLSDREIKVICTCLIYMRNEANHLSNEGRILIELSKEEITAIVVKIRPFTESQKAKAA